ncbi:synaptic vesicle 2-related protein-like [Ptychodera flava]|uniref:synaptic vesicle 2-related protein-like n=1 Tax=Ptychodera flava TaxID=63121 RepID=UPI00396A7169
MSLSYERLADSSNEDEEEVNVMHLRNVLSHRRFDKDGGNDSEVTFTVEDAVEHIGFGKFQIFLTLIMGTFSFSDACEMMLLAVLSPVLRCHWQLSSFQVACITTVVFVGMLIGSPVFGTPQTDLDETCSPRKNPRSLYIRLPQDHLQLWYLWFSAAFGYYGLVLISSEILEFDSVCGAMEKWNQDSLSEDVCYCQLLTKSDYLTLIFTTLGELLAIPINMILPDVIGRTRLLCLYFVVSAIGNGLILVCSTRLVLTITVFAVRACTSGIFNIVYLYTVEVYPTTVRALGLGSGSAIARVGAMITPFVAQVLLTYSIRSAMILYAGVCLLASILSITLPIETKGRSIQEI